MIIYKKEKTFFCRDLLIFFVDYYFKKNKFKNSLYSGKYIEKRLSIIKNINNFFSYNLSQSTLINSIENNLLDE